MLINFLSTLKDQGFSFRDGKDLLSCTLNNGINIDSSE